MPHERKRPFTENMNTSASSFSSRFPPEGTDFGRYCNMRIVGEGGMGRVYRAFDPMLEIEVAIKVLPRGIHSSKEEHRRFKREIKLLAAITIPGVVRLFDCGECDGWQYYTMELVEGSSITDYSESKELSQEDRLTLILNLAETLAALHEADIIHRDLKPSNVLVAEDGTVRLTDFGIAKSFNQSQQHSAITLNDSRPGTPFYMSPESSSKLRDRETAKRADVYSLGVVAYELLTGRLPYDVENLSATECVLVIREETPHSFRDRHTQIAPEIEMPIMAALEKDAEKRPGAASLAGMLRQAMSSEDELPAPKKPRSRWLTAAAAIIAGAGIMLLHAYLIRQREAPQPILVESTTGNGEAVTSDEQTNGGNSDIQDGSAETTSDNSVGTDGVAIDGGRDKTDDSQSTEELFKRVFAAASLAMAEGRWDQAEASFAELKTIPGYETCIEAENGLKAVSCGRLMMQAKEALERKNWPEVLRLADAILKIDPTHMEASVLKNQASEALVPQVRLSTWDNGKEIEGAQVLVDGIPLIRKTPLTVKRDVIKGKRIAIAMPRTPDVYYKPFETVWRSEDDEFKVELEAIRAVVAVDLNMTMVPISAGSFIMGDDFRSHRVKPKHKVTLTNDFWISRYEVNQDQYHIITRRNPSRDKGLQKPVVSVSWYEAVAFCKKLTERERKAGRLPKNYVYRLPTEAEWEYACRAETKGPYPFKTGVTLTSRIAASESGLKSPANVGYGTPNPWGIYNMNGNVREWVQDNYANYDAKTKTDPLVRSRRSDRVVRGGSWAKPMNKCTSTYRDRSITGLKHFSDVGFRIVLAKPLK